MKRSLIILSLMAVMGCGTTTQPIDDAWQAFESGNYADAYQKFGALVD